MNRKRLIRWLQLWLLLVLVVGTGGGAMAATSVSVRIHPLPKTSIDGTTQTCAGITRAYSARDAMSTYRWAITGAGNTIVGADDGQQVNVVWLTSGTLSLTYTDANGCDNTATINVAVDPTYTNVENVTLCQFDNYTWLGVPVATDNAGDSTYYHTKQTAQGCDSLFILNVQVLPAPSVTLTYTTTSFKDVMVMSPVTLVATPATYDSYKFVLNGTAVSDGRDAEVTVQSPLYYRKENQASVQVTSADNCTGTASIRFVLDVVMPNVFTPDGDGYNDFFMQGYDLKIFNRYGHVLYRGTDGWDGKYKGQEMPEATYFYEVKIKGENNNVETFAGNVRLERNN